MEVKAAFQRSRRFYCCQPCDAAAPTAATGVGPVQLLMALPGCSATGVAPDLQLPANKGATSGTTAAAVAVNLPLPPVSSAPAAGTAISTSYALLLLLLRRTGSTLGLLLLPTLSDDAEGGATAAGVDLLLPAGEPAGGGLAERPVSLRGPPGGDADSATPLSTLWA